MRPERPAAVPTAGSGSGRTPDGLPRLHQVVPAPGSCGHPPCARTQGTREATCGTRFHRPESGGSRNWDRSRPGRLSCTDLSSDRLWTSPRCAQTATPSHKAGALATGLDSRGGARHRRAHAAGAQHQRRASGDGPDLSSKCVSHANSPSCGLSHGRGNYRAS